MRHVQFLTAERKAARRRCVMVEELVVDLANELNLHYSTATGQLYYSDDWGINVIELEDHMVALVREIFEP